MFSVVILTLCAYSQNLTDLVFFQVRGSQCCEWPDSQAIASVVFLSPSFLPFGIRIDVGRSCPAVQTVPGLVQEHSASNASWQALSVSG